MSSLESRIDAAIAAAASFNMTSAGSEAALSRSLNCIHTDKTQGPAIWDLHAGLLTFLRTVFHDAAPQTLFAQIFDREPKGRGAHFDVYDPLLHPDFPWVALFNLTGDSTVSAFPLPEALSHRYDNEHPTPDEAAYAARRQLVAEALADPHIRPEKGMLLPGCGLIIPQRQHGPDWVHDIIPMHEDNPGRFIKVVAVKGRHAENDLRNFGYGPVDGVLQAALLSIPVTESGDDVSRRRRRCNVD